jgi:hypothetical protein
MILVMKNRRNAGKRKTYCIHGHEYTPENTYIKSTGIRGCRKCKANHAAAYRLKRYGAPKPRKPSAKMQIEALVKALKRLEVACENLAATRPQGVYEAMIDGGQGDCLINLDQARANARKVLGDVGTALK